MKTNYSFNNHLGKPAFFQSQNDAASYLGIAHSTFNRLIKDGKIQGERVGDGETRKHYYFSTASLDRFQLDSAREKLGGKFDDQFKKAVEIAHDFQMLNALIVEGEMVKGSKFSEACQKRVFPSENSTLEAGQGSHIFTQFLVYCCNVSLAEYSKLCKPLKSWVYNEVYYHATDPTKEEIRFFSNPILTDKGGAEVATVGATRGRSTR